MNVVGYILIGLFLIPLLFGWFVLFMFPLGALAVGAVAAPFAIRHTMKASRKRVLIVEHDSSMKAALRQIVESADPHAIITESNTQEEAKRMIFERAKIRDSFDFVISDIFSTDHWHKVEQPKFLQKPVDSADGHSFIRNALANA